MTPSRGMLLRLWNSGNAVRSCSNRMTARMEFRPIRLAKYSQSISLSLHGLSKDGSIHHEDLSASQRANDNHSCNNSIHPDGIDPSLFESTTEEYSDSLEESRFNGHSRQSDPSALLSALLERDLKQATNTLKELRHLRNEVEHHIEFAGAARRCALEEDYQGCLYWLDIVPNYNSLGHSVTSSESYHQDRAHIAKALRTMMNGRAEPYVVCLALLKIISKGYIEAGDDVNKAICQTMTWLLRHGRVLEDGDAQKWTWHLWKTFLKTSIRAKSGQDAGPSTSSTAGHLGEDLETHLVKVFNLCLRTLCLAGKFEAAILWVKNSHTFNLTDALPGTRLQSFTWRVFLEEILDRNSAACDTLRNQAGALAAELQALSDSYPKDAKLRHLTYVTQHIIIDRNAVTLSEECTLDEQVVDALDCNDRIAAISFLHQALIGAHEGARWSHLPKAMTLASLQRAVSERGDKSEEQNLQFYLEALSNARGAKGLVPLTDLLRLSQDEEHVECVSLCLKKFQCRDLERLAQLVDPERFSQSSMEPSYTSRLHENKYATYLALKSLLYLCNNDFFKINRVYEAWLQSISHHRGSLREIHGQSSESVDEIYEEADNEYLFMGDFDLETQADYSDSIMHRGPPNSSPTIYHFNLFLKMVPKAFGITAHDRGASMKHLLISSDHYEKSIEFAFDIVKEMHNFQVEPNTSTWSILLSLMARNINAISSSSTSQSSSATAPPSLTGGISLFNQGNLISANDEMIANNQRDEEENQKQWNKIWSLTSALGMGPNHLHTSNSSLPRATALTYASLIYAFLKVPVSRGGPCLKEATKVKRWMLEDKEALRDAKRYQKPINRILHFHRKVAKRHHENKIGKEGIQALASEEIDHHHVQQTVNPI